jgi:hypothetical protein
VNFQICWESFETVDVQIPSENFWNSGFPNMRGKIILIENMLVPHLTSFLGKKIQTWTSLLTFSLNIDHFFVKHNSICGQKNLIVE